MQVERNDGILEMPELWTPEKMKNALARKDVKEIHIFNLKPGMNLNIKNRIYRVESINSKGKKAIIHLEKIHDIKKK